MDWDRLRIFHAVAEAGSFTHAGEQLGLSQSAVSRQISALEDELRISLFHRHARGLILTEQGETLLKTARMVSGQIKLALAEVTDGRDKPRGRLRITTTVGLGSFWLTPRMRRFIEIYPDIDTELVLDDHELDLSMREADVALRLHPPTQSDLIQRKLMTVHYRVVAAPSYLERKGAPADLGDLRRHDLVTYGGEVPKPIAGVNWLAGAAGGAPIKPVLQVNNIYGMYKAVSAGVGIAALPAYMVEENSKLVRLLPEADTPSFDTYFVYPEELRQSKRVAAFRDFMLQEVRAWNF